MAGRGSKGWAGQGRQEPGSWAGGACGTLAHLGIGTSTSCPSARGLSRSGDSDTALTTLGTAYTDTKAQQSSQFKESQAERLEH